MDDSVKSVCVVESKTSMVEGASPPTSGGNSNDSSKEEQDRLAAALALTALPDSIRSSQNYIIRGESSVQSNSSNRQNGFQHIPIQALPTQPGRSTINRAVAKAKLGSNATNRAPSATRSAGEVGRNKLEKKNGNTNKGKTSVTDGSRLSKDPTIAQYYQNTGEENCAKFRNVSSCSNTPESSKVAYSFAAKRTVAGEKDVHSTTNFVQDLSVDSSLVSSESVATTEQTLRYITGMSSVANQMQVQSCRMSHLPVHILPNVAASCVPFTQPIGQTGNVKVQTFRHHPTLPMTGKSVTNAITVQSHTLEKRHGLPVAINRQVVSVKESDVTSMDISTLSLPTNASPYQETIANESSKSCTKMFLPKKNTPVKSILDHPVSKVSPTLPERPTPNMSEIALSNLEDKHRPLALMVSQVALQYLEPNQGPIHMLPMAIGCPQNVSNKSVGQSKSQKNTPPKKLSLPITIPEGPPSRSSMINTPGKVGSSAANRGSSPFTEMFPVGNNNPLLPRVFHSFLPPGIEGNLQPTDLSMKKLSTKSGRSLLKTGIPAHDQPQDLSMSKARKDISRQITTNIGPPVETSLVAKSMEVTRTFETKMNEIHGGLKLPISRPGQVHLEDVTNNTLVRKMAANDAAGLTVVNLEKFNNQTMPPLIRGIPQNVGKALINAQHTKGRPVLPVHSVSDTTVNSLPSVVMSTGHIEPGSQKDKTSSDTTLITTKSVSPELNQVVDTSAVKRTNQPIAVRSSNIPVTFTSKEPRVTMIGTASSSVAMRDVESLPHTDIEQNKLPPKKRRRYPDFQNNDLTDSPQNSPNTCQANTNAMPCEVSRLEGESSPRKGAYTPPSSPQKAMSAHVVQPMTEKGPLYINTSSPGPASVRTESPSSHSSPSETRSTDSPVHVDPRRNLIMLKECQMAVKPDDDGDLPLHIAVVQGEEGVVDRLIPMMQMLGSPVDQYNDLRQTPLHLAIITKELGIVTKLLHAGASPNLADRKGQTGVHLAVCHGFPAGLTALLQLSNTKVDLDVKNYEGLSPLHIAVQSGCKSLVEILLKAGAEVDTMDGKSGKTPLYNAAELNHDHLVQILLENGANVNIANYSGSTPMSVANAKGYYTKIVNLLLKYGADPGSNTQTQSVSPSATPKPSIRQVLRQSLSRGETRSGKKSRGTSSAPSTSGQRKRAAKTSDGSQQPHKCAKSESHDPSKFLENPLNLTSPKIVSSNPGTPVTYSPVTPLSSVKSPDSAESEGDSSGRGQPLPLTVQQTSRKSELVGPSQVTQPFSPGAPALASASSLSDSVASCSSQQTAGPALQSSGSRIKKELPVMGTSWPRNVELAHSLSSTGPTASSASSPSHSTMSTNLPVMVSESEGQMVFTVPDLSIAGGQPIPKQILPPIGTGLPRSPYSSSSSPTSASVCVVQDSTSASGASMVESPVTSYAKAHQETGSEFYGGPGGRKAMVLRTSDYPGDLNLKTEKTCTAELETTDSSDSFMIDESGTFEDETNMEEAVTDSADEDTTGDSPQQQAAMDSRESSYSPSDLDRDKMKDEH